MKRKILLLSSVIVLMLSVAFIFTGCSSGVSETEPSVYLVNPSSTHNSISFEIIENDVLNTGSITKIELIHGNDEPVEATDLYVRQFDNLLSDTKYSVKVTYSYIFDGEEKTDVKTLDITTEALNEPTVLLLNAIATSTSVDFEIYKKDTDRACTIQKIELLQGDKEPVVASDTSVRSFNNLLSNTKYTIKLTYKYNLNDGEGDVIKTSLLNFTTDKTETPRVKVYLTDSSTSSVSFVLDTNDVDDVCTIGKIELYKGNTSIAVSGADTRSFDKLLSDTRYTIKVNYSYDINDGNGVQNKVATYDVYTDEVDKPFVAITGAVATDTTINFEIEELDKHNVGNVKKIELLLFDYLVYETTNISVRGFMGLLPGLTYNIRVTYAYDLNDGNGEQELIKVLSVQTTSSGEEGLYPSLPENPDEEFPSYEDATINIACTTWSPNPSYPWSTVELCVKPGSSSGFGQLIDTAVLEREAFIEELFSVDVNFINASRYMLSDAIETAFLSGNMSYELAMPRVMETHSLAVKGYVYDLADSEILDLSSPYFRQETVKEFTVDGHTLFIGGDFSNLDIETAYVMYFNKNLLGETESSKIYSSVFNGSWTFDKLVAYANSVYEDDGDGYEDDGDSFGLSVNSLDKFYEYFGVNHVGVNPDTQCFELTINSDKVDTIINAIITCNNANWCHDKWGSDSYWGSNAVEAFNEDRLMFYNECIYNSRQLTAEFGVVPFPMLSEDQGRYYAPCSTQQATVMCIPKVTVDRELSEYFVDILAATGTLYTMDAYYTSLIAERNWGEYEIDVLGEYILPSISYDHASTVEWSSVFPDLRANSYSGNTNNFDTFYSTGEANALAMIQKWNDAWINYNDYMIVNVE
ncbi:MAG: hypothetical protein IJY41_00655 [Clostridia bacterium]|nr:hypothetical protein [Clostridia bacterium]